MIESLNVDHDDVSVVVVMPWVGSVESDTDLLIEDAFGVGFWGVDAFGWQFYWELFVVELFPADIFFVFLLISD